MRLAGPCRSGQSEIDQINILNASFKAMHVALDHLKLRPELLLIDGNRFKPYGEIKFECIIKGDASISPSLLLGVSQNPSRRLMTRLAEHFRLRLGDQCRVCTLEHREGIEDWGSPRSSEVISTVPSQLELFD